MDTGWTDGLSVSLSMKSLGWSWPMNLLSLVNSVLIIITFFFAFILFNVAVAWLRFVKAGKVDQFDI